jgi:tRNA 2-thiouridine synthesizing protein A
VSPPPQEVNPALAREPIEVDARGLRCPLPVIRLAEVARDAPQGTCIVVLATDPAARYDIPAWCRMRHHELVELSEVSDPVAGSSATEEGAPADSAQTSGAQGEGAQGKGPQGEGAHSEGAQSKGLNGESAQGESAKTGMAHGEGARQKGAPTQGAPPAYLRFVVRLLAQPANAGGSGSGRERWSRAK